jgi:CPA2 family monovalent cation:H+ antiporter-2
LALLLFFGLLTVPRLMRAVVGLGRAETTAVASVGLAFGTAFLAAKFDYSVALGAFIAGSLVAESGVEKTIEHAVQPVRDIFAAIFFVSVGMLIDPAEITAHWPAVLVFLAAVVLGNVTAVALGTFLTGESVQTSVKTGMSMAQIGEFSFIIASLGMDMGTTGKLLYSIAVAVSGITTLLTLQTFVALYGSWIDQLGSRASDQHTMHIRRSIRWLLADAIVVTAVVIVASTQMERISVIARERLEISPAFSRGPRGPLLGL